MKQELRSKATKDSILRAAVECFQKKGYYTADIDDICKKANLTKGAFYYLFIIILQANKTLFWNC
jgi:AcrR family transcriptional regulator